MLAYMNDASTRRTPIQHFGRRSRLSPKVQRSNFLLLSSPLTTAIGTTQTNFAASAHVRFWHKADIATLLNDVRFRG
jgi:hypothetical protein